VIEFEQAGFNYGENAVLRELTLGLTPAGFHVLLGASGSGKTTLLRLCYLDLEPSAGRILWSGHAVRPNDRKASAALRRTIGVVPRDPGFLDHLSLLENIALPLAVGGIRPEDRAADLQALLEWVDLGGFGHRAPAALTRAERHRAALARAVILSPEVILADEPAAAGDWQAGQRLLELLVELNRMGKTVLVATHDPNVLEILDGEVAARVLHLADGRVADLEMAQ
jgi:cell division transport system ATP-binding protein